MRRLLSIASALALAITPAFAQSSGQLAPNVPVAGSNTSPVVTVPGTNPSSSGAGAFDNSVPINNAFSQKPNGVLAGSVYLPGGTYHVSHQLSVPPGQCLQGDPGWPTVIDVDTDFDPTALGIAVINPPTNTRNIKPCIHNITFFEHLPPDITSTATAVSSGSSTVVVSNPTAPIVNGMYVVDATTISAINQAAGVAATTVSNVTGTGPYTVTLSTPTTANVLANDIIHFASPRSAATSLGSCNTTTPGSGVCKYPWAVYNAGAGNLDLDYVFMPQGWDGIFSQGPTFHFGFIMMAGLDQSLNVSSDGNASTLDTLLHWNFTEVLTPTLALDDIFLDGQAVAANFGAVAGLHVGTLQSYEGSVNITSSTFWGHFDSLMLDSSFAVLNVTACGFETSIGQMYSTKGGFTGGPAITMNDPSGACRLTINSLSMTYGNAAFPAISVVNGGLAIDGGWIKDSDSGTNVNFMSQSGGYFQITGTRLACASPAGANHTYFVQTGGAATIKNNTLNECPSETNSVAFNLTDNAGNDVRNNNLNGWLFTPPGQLGLYGNSRLITIAASETYTPRSDLVSEKVIAIGPGGSGGGGALQASLSACSGGGGGGGGGVNVGWFTAAQVGASQTVTIGQPGTIGAAATSSSNPGSPGGTGTNTTFGSLLTGFHGGAGAGGQVGTASGGGAGAAGPFNLGGAGSGATPGGNGSGLGGSGSAGTNALSQGVTGYAGGGAGGAASGASAVGAGAAWAPGGGGAGGGLTTLNAPANGGSGGFAVVGSSGGAGGAGIGGPGLSPSASVAADQAFGGGGAGGASSVTAAFAGGAGGFPGGGGGGGGCADNSGTAAAGAFGGAGEILIYESY